LTVTKEQLDHIIRVELGINPEDEVIDFELIERKGDRERFDRAKEEYRRNLETHPNRSEVAKRLYVGDELILYIRNRHDRATFNGIDENNAKYYPFCNIEEIKRIQHMQNAEDYLLKLRADAIANNPRSIRIFLSRYNKNPTDWALSSFYENTAFSRYIQKLPKNQATECRQVPAGFAYLREPNGACIKSEFGNLIVISEALEYFLFFMNIFIFSKGWEISHKDSLSAFVIATKTMLRTEPLDFDLDPRASLPKKITRECWAMVRAQINFIIGHEYAHLLLGHLKGNAIAFDSLAMLGSAISSSTKSKYYTPRQSQEFDADVGSILHANYSDAETATNLDAAAIFFIGLDLFYTVDDYINPPINQIKTHPDPLDRIWHLRNAVHLARPGSQQYSYPTDGLLSVIEAMNIFKKFLIENFLPVQIELLEDFQSVYLPSFHHQKLYDRFDY